jgi:hypothetical protein
MGVVVWNFVSLRGICVSEKHLFLGGGLGNTILTYVFRARLWKKIKIRCTRRVQIDIEVYCSYAETSFM